MRNRGLHAEGNPVLCILFFRESPLKSKLLVRLLARAVKTQAAWTPDNSTLSVRSAVPNSAQPYLELSYHVILRVFEVVST